MGWKNVFLFKCQLLRYSKINVNLGVIYPSQFSSEDHEVDQYDGHSIYQLISNQFTVARKCKKKMILKLLSPSQSKWLRNNETGFHGLLRDCSKRHDDNARNVNNISTATVSSTRNTLSVRSVLSSPANMFDWAWNGDVMNHGIKHTKRSLNRLTAYANSWQTSYFYCNTNGTDGIR